jgi:hypothetical protein
LPETKTARAKARTHRAALAENLSVTSAATTATLGTGWTREPIDFDFDFDFDF